MLKAMSIEDEKIDQIIEAHTETVNGLKEERDNLKADAEKLEAVQKELNKLKEDTAKDDGKNSWKVKYDAMKEEFDEYKAEVEAKATKATKEEAFRALLKEVGVAEKRINSVVKVSDIDAIELDKDGNIKDADKLKDSVKEEWSDFIQTEQTKGADTSNPPQNNGGKKTREEILNIKDTAERQAAMAENHELFGI
jgi:hypothetical protein